MKEYTLPAIWDALKFAHRYGLDFGPTGKDFYVGGNGKLVVFPVLPDDPPIFDLPDAFVPVPPSLKVHHWPEMVGWLGTQKLFAAESSGSHHECYYIIADDEAALGDPFITSLNIQVGQPAYIKDKHELRVWTGINWKKP